ncbi:response regulator transcription factor [Streptomyces sp. 4503]|uniref:Response regulator transcription factor n=1 Tax=Streptomyces niphimycinicus TaxID=2842201 RepID=A0ABS6C8L6_9ACTN|nr:response regulator transcription factor [Streptomyces niphimycinicus]MBU3863241.1 response regulator transcription factor [Streptomyces niphimycinicus]
MRVFIAESDPVSRRRIRRILRENESCELVGEVAEGNELAGLVGRSDPDAVVLCQDIVSNNSSVVPWLAGEIGAAVILTAATSGGPTVWRGMTSGAVGYLLKDRLAGELEMALIAAEMGGIFVSPPLLRQLFGYIEDRFGEAGIEQPSAQEIVRSLLPREQETLYRLAAGQSTEEIAQEMSVAISTVRAYVSRILTKLGLRSRGEAVSLAFRSGFYKVDRSLEIG